MDLVLNSPVVAASVTAFFSFALGIIATYFKQRNTLIQAKHELELQSQSLDFEDFVRDWGSVLDDIAALSEKTNLDRFLIFRAWNGAWSPRWTTAVFQFRKGKQENISYVHFELDDDYVDRLRQISQGKDLYFSVNELPPSAVRAVYLNEGVKASYWALIHAKEINSHSRSITYCSFATQDEAGFDENTRTRFKLILGKLRAIAEKKDI